MLRLGSMHGVRGDLGMTAKQRRQHLYVVGSTGVGKSKLLEYLIRQDIKARPQTKSGLLLLDPHGEIYNNTIKWLAASGPASLKRPVIPVDLTQDEWVVAYNLLKHRTSRPSVVVGAMMSAIMHVFGANSLWQTPLLARWLQNTLRLLYDGKVALTELIPLLEDPTFRLQLIGESSDEMARRDWARAAQFTPKQFEEEIGSTLNRLQAFIRNETFEASFGQTAVSLDLRKAMDDGAIILVNCSQTGGKMSEFDCQLFATMMLSDLWTAAKERKKGDHLKPFYVYIDEFQNFVTETIAKNLDQARGYGLHLTLAHQFPKQLRNEGIAGEKIYDSVLTNASSKIVFRLEHPDDLESLTKWLYMRTVNPDKVQLELYSTKVMGQREETRTVTTTSHTSNWNHATGSSRGTGSSSGTSQSRERQEDGEESDSMTVGDNEGESTTDVTNESNTSGGSESESSGEVPVFIPVYGKELSSVTLEPLDVQWFRRMQELASQDDREFVARLVGMNAPLSLRTFDVKQPRCTECMVQTYLKKRYNKLPFALPLPEARLIVEERRLKLLNDAKTTLYTDEATTARRVKSKIKKPTDS